MTSSFSSQKQLTAESIGTALLLATVVGSGIMAEQLAGGNVAIALLGNTIPTGAILIVLITMLAPVSGAHFNPAVSFVFAWRREISWQLCAGFIVAQIVAGIAGVWMAHGMFAEDILQASTKARSGPSQWFSEAVATFGLIFTILATRSSAPQFVATAVGLYITAAYWFTASTSFANPAVTIARGFSDTFAGIQPADIPYFIIAQLVGAAIAALLYRWMFSDNGEEK